MADNLHHVLHCEPFVRELVNMIIAIFVEGSCVGCGIVQPMLSIHEFFETIGYSMSLSSLSASSLSGDPCAPLMLEGPALAEYEG